MKSSLAGRLLIYLAVMLLVYTFVHTAAGAPVMPVEPPFLAWSVPDTGPDPELAQLRHDNQRLRHKLRSTRRLIVRRWECKP